MSHLEKDDFKYTNIGVFITSQTDFIFPKESTVIMKHCDINIYHSNQRKTNEQCTVL